jgi:hypothetical protein
MNLTKALLYLKNRVECRFLHLVSDNSNSVPRLLKNKGKNYGIKRKVLEL